MNLLGMHAEHTSLRSFATAFFTTLGVTDFQQRESGNYVDGYYLRGSLDGMILTVARADEDEPLFNDLPYWIYISANTGEPNALELAVSKVIKDKAIPAGFRLAYIVNFGKRGQQRIDY